MTFASQVEGANATLFVYVFVRGLGVVYSNAPFPARWQYPGALDGEIHHPDGLVDEVWSWSPTLEPGTMSIAQSLAPWAGAPSPERLQLRVVLDELWQSILAKNIYRTDEPTAIMTDDCSTVATAIELDDVTAFDASGVVHSGVEAIEYDAIVGDTLDTLTRGLWLSPPTYHVADWPSGTLGASGPYVSTRPLAIGGRRVDVWVGTGRYTLAGELVPNGATPCSDSDQCFSYTLDNARMSPDLLFAQLDLTDAIGLLRAKAATFLPRAVVSPPPNSIFLDESKNVLRVSDTTQTYIEAWVQPTVQRGWQRISTLSVSSESYPLRTTTDWSFSLVPVEGGTGLRVSFVLDCKGTIPDTTITLESSSFLRSLGYDEPAALRAFTTTYVSGVSSTASFEHTFDKPIALLRFAALRSDVGQVIPIAALDSWPDVGPDQNVHAAPGESAYSVVVKVGDEILGCTQAAVAFVDGTTITTQSALTVVARGVLGSQPTELDILSDGEPFELVQPVCISLPFDEAIATVLCGGRQDTEPFGQQSWYGYGAMLPDTWLDFDVTSAPTVNVVLFEPTEVRNVIEPILVAFQYQLVADPASGKLTLRKTPQPGSLDVPIATIDHDSIDTNAGIEWDMPDDLVVTRLDFEGLDFDHGLADGRTLTIANGFALATWGGGNALPYDARALPLGYDPLSIADALFVYWGTPFLVLEFAVNSGLGLWLRPGDPVYVTHSLIPSLIAVSRGVTELAGFVFRVTSTFYASTGDKVSTIKVVIPAISGLNFAGYAPTALATAVADVGGDARFTTTDTVFSPDTRLDASFFEPGDIVTVFPRWERSSEVSCEIVSIAGNLILTDMAIGDVPGVADWLIEHAAWATATIAEERYVHLRPTSDPYHYG
jgi:hypothetical protein